MDLDLTTQAVSLLAARTSTLAGIAVLRRTNQMQAALLEVLDPPARATPAAGQGRQVDKTA